MNDEGPTLLVGAMWCGHFGMVKALLRCLSADLNARDRDRCLLLSLVIKDGLFLV